MRSRFGCRVSVADVVEGIRVVVRAKRRGRKFASRVVAERVVLRRAVSRRRASCKYCRIESAKIHRIKFLSESFPSRASFHFLQ